MAGAALIALTVVGLVASAIIRPTALESAVTACELTDNEYVVVGDGGHAVTLDGASDEGGDGVSVFEEACVLGELKASTAALTQMSSTTSLQGRQSASWSDVNASWTYHPDNGLDLILTTK